MHFLPQGYGVVIIEGGNCGIFLSTGIIVAVFRHDGITAWNSEVLKMSVKTPASWSAHSLSTCPGLLLPLLSKCLLSSGFSCAQTEWLLIRARNTFPVVSQISIHPSIHYCPLIWGRVAGAAA